MLDLNKLIDRARREVETRFALSQEAMRQGNPPASKAAIEEAQQLKAIYRLLQRLRDYDLQEPRPAAGDNDLPTIRVRFTAYEIRCGEADQTLFSLEGAELRDLLRDLASSQTKVGRVARANLDEIFRASMVSLRDYLLQDVKTEKGTESTA